MKWTAAQESAIGARGKTLLVSAAAGSGKTATLTERIIRSVMDENDGKDISRMLIVTYTRAAAAELKTKISKALASSLAENPGNRHLASQMMLLESAKICTIDSFYYDIVKSNFSRLGISGNLRIVDNAEMTLICYNEMENLIDDFYNADPDFIDFMDHFIPVRGADRTVDIFLSIYQSLLNYRGGVSLLTDYTAALRRASECDFLSTAYGSAAALQSEIALEYMKNALSAACDFFLSGGDEKLLNNYYPAFRNDLDTVEQALACVKAADYEGARQAFGAYQKLSLKRITGEKDPYVARLQEQRKQISLQLPALKNEYFNLSAEEISSLMLSTAAVTEKLFTLLDEYHKRIMAEKERRGICDFNDIRRYVLKLLLDADGNPTDIADDIRERFDEIYIDEYQDVDEMQDAIFRAVSRPDNRFMVGDIKQSIYGFRGADSGVFAGYKNRFPLIGSREAEDANGCSVFMSDNFRCDKSIVDFTNLVSSYLFGNCGKSIGYRPEDNLVFSKALPYENYQSPKVVLALTGIESDEPTDEEEMPEYPEGEYIAAEIRRLVDGEKKADGTPIRYRDIAVLMRSTTDLEALTALFEREGIPTQSDDKSNFFENPNILLVLSLLSVIDNPRRDIPLAGTLRSPLYGFRFDDLITVRRASDDSLSLFDALEAYAATGDTPLRKQCTAFLESLGYWRDKATAYPVDKLLKLLYREFSLTSLSTNDSSHLMRLYEYAREFEANSFHGLYNFISFLDEIIESGTRLDAEASSADNDAVRFLTIHHSKGLEYPVCFLYGMGKSFNEKYTRENIQFDPALGLAMTLHDSTGFAATDTPVRHAIIDRKLLSGREEEMRVLYVAMTRARERLYLTAKSAKPDKLMEKLRGYTQFGKEYGIRSSHSYLDWILSAILAGNDNGSYRIEYVTADNAVHTDTAEKSEVVAVPAPVPVEDPAVTELFRKRFSFEYPYQHITALPAKLSVSALYPAILDETDRDEIDAASLEDAFVYPESLLPDDAADGAEKGTATHTFLQFCDFDAVVRHGVVEELNRLQEQKFIDSRTARLCNVRQLENFFRSELFSRIRSADEVRREQRFNIFLPASDFTQIPEKAEQLADEMIAVQGVIDLFFREKNGNIILVDYKTDFLTAEELAQPALAEAKLIARHREQLSYYAKAIARLCGKAPDKTLIYSLPLGKTVSL